ncbi:MAG: hypothetical protein EOP51_17290 [Sphingobacteriales bacterium]|nr:MAG: hypothetical protein EOP51_17290 [Sphingobacteriales bacterium]
MQDLQLLNDKLDALLRKHTALQAENKQLKEVVGNQLRAIESLNSELAAMEQNVAAKTLESTLGDTEDKVVLRKQLDSVISEIDKILNTLND